MGADPIKQVYHPVLDFCDETLSKNTLEKLSLLTGSLFEYVKHVYIPEGHFESSDIDFLGYTFSTIPNHNEDVEPIVVFKL